MLLALTIGAAALGFVLIERWESATRTPTALDGVNAGSDGVSPFTATMYYVAADGRGLVRREVEVPYGADTLSRARIIVARQLETAPRQLLSPFPGGRACARSTWPMTASSFVDLSGEVTTEHSGGSLDELLTVYALVNALTTNVAEVGAVQILVDGREVGHARRPHRPAPAADPEPDVGRRSASVRTRKPNEFA